MLTTILTDDEWKQTSNGAYDQIKGLLPVMHRCGMHDEVALIDRERLCLDRLYEKSAAFTILSPYRTEFRDSYRRILPQFVGISEKLQIVLGEKWETGLSPDKVFNTPEGEFIFGYQDVDNPRGIANGSLIPGYLPFMLSRLILIETDQRTAGTLKPRGHGLCPSFNGPGRPGPQGKKKFLLELKKA